MPSEVWTPVYIGVGSNLCDPIAQVATARTQILNLPRTKSFLWSRLYRTSPVGPQDQPDYINAVVGCVTQLGALEMLSELKSMERAMGREQLTVRWGPRIIDFDLLVFGDMQIREAMLTVPHQELAHRAFALKPLIDIAPSLNIPGLGNVAKLAEALDQHAVETL